MSESRSPPSFKRQSGASQGTKVKDPRWLRVEICRDFAAGKCRRSDFECRFAHPKKDCVSENNKVTVCYDSLKGRCCRENCKFYHPPFHIKEHLLAFGKYLQQQRLEKDKELEDIHSPTADESGEADSVITATKVTPSDMGSSAVQNGQGHITSHNNRPESAFRRNSYEMGRHFAYNAPINMYEDSSGLVYYSPVPPTNFPGWSSPQQVYFPNLQRPISSPPALMYQGYPAPSMPVLEPVATANQGFYPVQQGRQVLVNNSPQYYQTVPQIMVVAYPQTGMVSPGWSPDQRHLFTFAQTPEQASDIDRPNSI